jgi:hypothetical protein
VSHSIESIETSGVSVSAFWITAPCGVSLSGFGEEVLDDMSGVGFLGAHFTHDVLLDLVSHNFESMLGRLTSILIFLPLSLSSVRDLAMILKRTVSRESIPNNVSWPNHAWSGVVLEALNIAIGITAGAWFSPLGEGMDQSSSVSDDGGLSSSDSVYHSLGSTVEVHGNLLCLLGLGLSLEPVSPLLGVVGKVLPVGREVDLSVGVVLAWGLNINSHFSEMSLVALDSASFMLWSHGVQFIAPF